MKDNNILHDHKWTLEFLWKSIIQAGMNSVHAEYAYGKHKK
jgi:hypothetical protein